MPAWHGKLEHVDVFTLLHILEKRTGGNDFSGDRRDFFYPPAPRLNKFYVAQSGFHAEREGQALCGGNKVYRDPIAFRVTLDSIEKNSGACFRALVDDFRER